MNNYVRRSIKNFKNISRLWFSHFHLAILSPCEIISTSSYDCSPKIPGRSSAPFKSHQIIRCALWRHTGFHVTRCHEDVTPSNSVVAVETLEVSGVGIKFCWNFFLWEAEFGTPADKTFVVGNLEKTGNISLCLQENLNGTLLLNFMNYYKGTIIGLICFYIFGKVFRNYLFIFDKILICG